MKRYWQHTASSVPKRFGKGARKVGLPSGFVTLSQNAHRLLGDHLETDRTS